jgi:hypothetical protein
MLVRPRWIGRGAAWVKVIADFPDLAAGTDAEATYQAGAIARVVVAAHHAGARVAVHSTVRGTGQLVAAGVDSVEHGSSGLDEHAVTDLAGRGTAWTPTIGALVAMLDAPATADIVTYHHDPRQDPGQLARPAGVVAGGIRV